MQNTVLNIRSVFSGLYVDVSQVKEVWLRLAGALLVILLASCRSADQPVNVEVLQPHACDSVISGCMASNEQFNVEVQFEAGFSALKPFQLTLKITQKSAILIEDIQLIFSMVGMSMGLNKYRLVHDGNGTWVAQVTLPICTSGRSDWSADFEIKSPQQLWTLQIPFILNAKS